jgi:hypothetical protein
LKPSKESSTIIKDCIKVLDLLCAINDDIIESIQAAFEALILTDSVNGTLSQVELFAYCMMHTRRFVLPVLRKSTDLNGTSFHHALQC